MKKLREWFFRLRSRPRKSLEDKFKLLLKYELHKAITKPRINREEIYYGYGAWRRTDDVRLPSPSVKVDLSKTKTHLDNNQQNQS